MSLEAIILIWLLCAAVAAAIGHMKNRNVGESFLWGAVLGALGVVIVLFLPKGATPGMAKPGWYPDPMDDNRQKYWNGSEWSDLPSRPA